MHNWTLHDTDKASGGPGTSTHDNESALLLVQTVPVSESISCFLWWDSGSQVNLVTHRYASKVGAVGRPVKLILTVARDQKESMETKVYEVKLRDRSGTVHAIKAYGMDKITSKVERLSTGDFKRVTASFKGQKVVLENPQGMVDLLVGLPQLAIHPEKRAEHGSLVLMSSKFGTGSVLGGP
jgi:Putative peptidase (DUF1758)